MNYCKITLFFFLFPILLAAQAPITQVEGFLEVYLPQDTTSIYVGKESGRNVDNTFTRGNSFFGSSAGQENTLGQFNSFYGFASGQNNTIGQENSFFGLGSGSSNSEGDRNSFFGYLSGTDNQSGNSNSFFGARSGQLNTTGHSNSLFGVSSGTRNTTGSWNCFFGLHSGLINTTGHSNCFFGVFSGNKNTVGLYNSFYGDDSGFNNSTGSDNSFFGSNAGIDNTTGSDNSFIGKNSGTANQFGSNNTIIGSEANFIGANASNLNYASAVGSGAQVSTDNTLILGRPTDGVVAPGHIVISQDIPTVHHPDVRLMVMDDNNPTVSIRASDISTPKIQLTKDPVNADSDWTIRMNVPGDDELQFRHHGNIRLEISDQGRVKIPVLGSAGPTTLCRNASNEIATCSSSIRYKKDIEAYHGGIKILDQLRPVSYYWKESNEADLGFIAEEIAQIDERLITRSAQGDVEGVKYNRMTTILVNAIKEQQKEIRQLKDQLENSKNNAQSFEDRLALLEQNLNQNH